MSDTVKIGLVFAVMGLLVLGGMSLQPSPTIDVTEINVLPEKTLEMLDPAYSEKAVYADCNARFVFEISQTPEGVESKLSLWLHNLTDQVIAVVWDRCSIQLPNANTVNIVHEGHDPNDSWRYLTRAGSFPPTSVAPHGELFDTVIPVSEIILAKNTEDATESFSVSSGVLDQGPFMFVLAVEIGGQINYYTFRFLIR
jgi:hypothetical protein